MATIFVAFMYLITLVFRGETMLIEEIVKKLRRRLDLHKQT